MDILFLDVETTGTEPEVHSIIEIAAEFHRGGKVVDQFQAKLCHAESIINLGALKYNKTTLTTLSNYEDEQLATYNFVDWLLKLDVKGPLNVCGHNVHFDVAFIKNLLAKYNIEGINSIFSYRYLDTSDRGKFLIDGGVLDVEKSDKGNSLKRLAAALDINTQDLTLHTAAADTKLCAMVYYAMEEELRKLSTIASKIT